VEKRKKWKKYEQEMSRNVYTALKEMSAIAREI
jgi:hypothetical protein